MTVRLLHWKCFGYILADGTLSFRASYCFSDNSRYLSQFRTHTHSRKEPIQKGVSTMATEDNKTLMRRFYEEVMNQKNLAAIDDFLAPTFVNHSALQLGMLGGGIEEVKQYVSMILTTFPDLHYTVEDMIA